MRGSTEIGPLPRRDTRQLADQGGPPVLAGAPPASSIPRNTLFSLSRFPSFRSPTKPTRLFSFFSLPLVLPLSLRRSSCFFSRGCFNLGLATRSTAPESSTFHRPPGCRRATTSLAPAEGTGMQMLAPAEIRRISTGRSLTKQLARGLRIQPRETYEGSKQRGVRSLKRQSPDTGLADATA